MQYLIFASMCCGYVLHIKDYLGFSYLDYVSVMTYDYYGAWDNVTGINAPLYGRNYLEEDDDGHWKNVVSYDDELRLCRLISVSQNHSIHYWLSQGCPANKINLGLALYGRSFTLPNDSNSVSLGTETIGGGLGIIKEF